MKLLVTILTLAILNLFPQQIFAGFPDNSHPLFFIERSKNKNFVQYDIRFTENSDLPNSNPVNAYWVLENGSHEELNLIEKKYAYGVARQERLGKDRFSVSLVVFKNREILVEKIGGFFKAVVSISGQESILQRIYIKSEQRKIGLPKVLYIDLFGHTKESGVAIKERISPE